MTPEQRRHVALHEAGHAVASIVLGVPLEYASIRPGRTFAGVNVHAPGVPVDTSTLTQYPSLLQPLALRDHVERSIVVSLVGELAAMYFADESSRSAFTSDEAENMAREALVALGPRLAELVVEHEERQEPTDGDEANAWHLAQALVGDGVAYYVELLRIEARTLVVRYRDAILRVAAELERRAVLQGAQVAAIVYPPKPERS